MPTKAAWKPTTPPPRCIGRPPSDSGLAALWAYLHRQTRAIADSGTRILFVGLGGAKQDYWMHAHHGRVRAVMLGVGAAFDYLAGTKPQAPRWMRRSGLEWLFRLGAEPRRLWRRYLARNPRFAILALAQLVRTRFHEHRRTA